MTVPPKPPASPSTDLAEQECEFRVSADRLRAMADTMDRQAEEMLERMKRIGQRSWYAGSRDRPFQTMHLRRGR